MSNGTVRVALRRVPLFEGLSDEQLGYVLRGEEVVLEPGGYVARQGDPPGDFIVLLEGRVEWTTRVGGQDVHVLTGEPGAFFGHEPIFSNVPYPASGHALTEARLYRLGTDAFWRMLDVCPSVRGGVLETLAGRWQNLEAVSQQNARLVSLGTMAAGLAHELNNPAAAARRAADALRENLRGLRSLALTLGEHPLTPEQRDLLLKTLDAAGDGTRNGGPQDGLDPLQRGDLEDELADLLDEIGVEDAWDTAPAFVEAGLGRDGLEAVVGGLEPDVAGDVLAWLGATLSAEAAADEVGEGAARISDLVGAMREYTYLDQGPLQEVDVHEGLESTLTILRHKLQRGVEVVRDYDRTLPRVTARGGELNQVWTNLIDNAVDATDGEGRITIRTRREGDRVLVEVTDDGPGIPEEVRDRVFEPFFTTKGVGEGTGLGLDIARRLVVDAHEGDLRLLSDPKGGDIRFEIRLPITGPRRAAREEDR